MLHIHPTLDCFLFSDDVIPQDVSEDDSVDVKTQVPGGTTQVDSIDILDVDSKNKKGYAFMSV